MENSTVKYKNYGWKPDLPDQRDFMLQAPRHKEIQNFPSSKDLLPFCPPVYDQLTLGSCTMQSLCACHQFFQIKNNQKSWMPSRLFSYYNVRAMLRREMVDAGASLRDAMKSIAETGVCPAYDWPYIIKNFTTKPPPSCYQVASNFKITKYERLNQNLSSMKKVLANDCPFVFGFSVYESFEGDDIAKTGKMSMPTKFESVYGGHAVMAVGYDDATQCFTIRNSWGDQWGDHGYFYMPYEYIVNSSLTSDFWAVEFVDTKWD